MIASNLIHQNLEILELRDTVSKALKLFKELKLNQLPVFESKQFLGLIHQDKLCNANKGTLLKKFANTITHERINATQHLFEALSFFENNNLSLIPVCDTNGDYMGCIRNNTVLKKVCVLLNANHPGGILHLEIPLRDYSLAKIAHIVESDGAKILTSWCVQENKNSSDLEVILKINHNELSGIIETFKRYNYKVISSHHTNIYNKGLDERFDSFMHYLNI